MGELRTHFRPEFLNRVDDVIVFRPLDEDDLARIVELQLKRVAQLVEDLGFTLEVSHEARDVIVSEGYDPAFGARPLKRAIQRMLQDPLALRVLEEEVPEGATIRVSAAAQGSGLAIEVVPPLDAELP